MLYLNRADLEAQIDAAAPTAAAHLKAMLRPAVGYRPIHPDAEPTLKGLLAHLIGRGPKPAAQPEQTSAFGDYVGGLPRLADETAWPTVDGRPLAFVARVRVDPHADLGVTGALQLFYDADDERAGYDLQDIGHWRVVHDADDDLPLVPWPIDLPEAHQFPFVPLERATGWSMPDYWLPPSFGMTPPKAEISALIDGLDAYDTIEWSAILGGWPQPVQTADIEVTAQLASSGIDPAITGRRTDAISDEQGAPAWRLIMQVSSVREAKMDWISGGTLYVLIRQADLNAAAWDKAWVVAQFT